MPDIVVNYGVVPKHLKNPIAAEDNWEMEPMRFLLRGGRRAGRFLVENGNQITLERNRGAEDEVLATYFTTWIIAALLQQRGLLVIHANAVVTEHGAVVVTGESGAGKTSSVAKLIELGAKMLSDDIVVLRFDQSGRVVALPGVNKLNLCEDAAISMGYDLGVLVRNPFKDNKLFAPVAAMAKEPVTLHRIYWMDIGDNHELNVAPLAGMEKSVALIDCFYGPQLPDVASGQFTLFSAVLDQVKFYRLSRPVSCWSLDEVAGVILNG